MPNIDRLIDAYRDFQLVAHLDKRTEKFRGPLRLARTLWQDAVRELGGAEKARAWGLANSLPLSVIIDLELPPPSTEPPRRVTQRGPINPFSGQHEDR
jgi:hypothetical protein